MRCGRRGSRSMLQAYPRPERPQIFVCCCHHRSQLSSLASWPLRSETLAALRKAVVSASLVVAVTESGNLSKLMIESFKRMHGLHFKQPIAMKLKGDSDRKKESCCCTCFGGVLVMWCVACVSFFYHWSSLTLTWVRHCKKGWCTDRPWLSTWGRPEFAAWRRSSTPWPAPRPDPTARPGRSTPWKILRDRDGVSQASAARSGSNTRGRGLSTLFCAGFAPGVEEACLVDPTSLAVLEIEAVKA